ncbi:MAG: Obg family GTPase CgtA [Patescibacteria group bacterium]|nr:Obg family GTPase CgtA [Patescibacteria group bacterium]MCL5431759.1 Obg family GTPase CgtA [Patescibacteria group bacterium]
MLTDEAVITVCAGHGGAGRASFFKKGTGPDGGDGGKGGDVYLQTTSNLDALNRFASQKKYYATDGHEGAANKKTGADGRDLTLSVPIGTEVVDVDTKEVFNLDTTEQTVLVAKGGIGGKGNNALKSSRMTTPIHAQHGMPGQTRQLRLTLKLLADFGFVGLPNSGKSSLLNAITAANAKVGNYQFTTLEPNLGVYEDKVIADIPGLIEGASAGRGLGTKFLKHIEKVPVLLHCIAADSPNLLGDYKTVRSELKSYNPRLLKKKEVIILTKSDLAYEADIQKMVKTLSKVSKLVLPVSIFYDESLEKLKELINPA